MKILLLILNFISAQSDTVQFEYGNKEYMQQDENFESSWTVKENLPDGYYIILKNCYNELYKLREFQKIDSVIVLDINYFENNCVPYKSSDTGMDEVFRAFKGQPPIAEKHEIFSSGIEKYIEYYESGALKSIMILNTNLKAQPLVSERWHYEDGNLYLILEKKDTSDRYWIHYYYETGELEASGQFDEFNRPNGIWTTYHKNGNTKDEGPVCSECINKLWRPWILTPMVYKTGNWKYFSEDGILIEIRNENKNER